MFLTYHDFDVQQNELVLKNLPGYYFVFFTQDGCTYCRDLKPIFDRLESMTTGCNFVYVDVDQGNQQVVSMSHATNNPIEYVPLLLLYINGRCVDRFIPDEKAPSNNLTHMSNFLLSHSKQPQKTASTNQASTSSRIPPYSIGIPGNHASDRVCYIQPNKKV